MLTLKFHNDNNYIQKRPFIYSKRLRKSVTIEYVSNLYPNISTITRTSSFVLDSETGNPFVEATPENVARLLQQVPLDDFYLLNLIGGKSSLVDGK